MCVWSVSTGASLRGALWGWLFGERRSDPLSDGGQDTHCALGVFLGLTVSFSLHADIEKVMLCISTAFKFNSET